MPLTANTANTANTSVQPVQTISYLPVVANPVKHKPLQAAEEYGINKVAKTTAKSFALAIFGGVFISIAFISCISVTTGAEGAPWGLMRLAGGFSFSFGLILVIVCGGELFTSTVLTTVAWAQGLFSLAVLMKCWARIYLGNFIGAFLMVLLTIMAQMHLLDDGSWGMNAVHMAQSKLHHTWLQTFSLGLLCNLLVCLGIWMTFTTKDLIAKSVLVILPVAMFICSGFENSIANMFVVPLAIMIRTISPEFLISHGMLAADFADLTWTNFIAHNLIPVTLGNVFGGGIFVGLGYWMIERESKQPDLQFQTSHDSQPINSEIPQNLFPINPAMPLGETPILNTTLNNLTVNGVMDHMPLVKAAHEYIYQALCLS
ncbi:MAG: formate transporter FocA [Psychromonas sp.]